MLQLIYNNNKSFLEWDWMSIDFLINHFLHWEEFVCIQLADWLNYYCSASWLVELLLFCFLIHWIVTFLLADWLMFLVLTADWFIFQAFEWPCPNGSESRTPVLHPRNDTQPISLIHLWWETMIINLVWYFNWLGPPFTRKESWN